MAERTPPWPRAAQVRLPRTHAEDLERLIPTHALSHDTRGRIRAHQDEQDGRGVAEAGVEGDASFGGDAIEAKVKRAGQSRTACLRRQMVRAARTSGTSRSIICTGSAR